MVELLRIGKDVVVTDLKGLSRHSRGGSEEKKNKKYFSGNRDGRITGNRTEAMRAVLKKIQTI
jgi:hypothetical protein